MIGLMSLRALLPALPWVLVALSATHTGTLWYGWHWRGSVEADRVAVAQAALRQAQARVAGLAEAQAAASAERDALRQELDHAAIADPDAGRICLGADSVRRLGAP